MCGFAGEFLFAGGRADPDVIRRMAERLRHRGPDSAGEWLSADGRCAIAFHRLAVIDPAGSDQPMSTPEGDLTVACNGEIYNYAELRRELQQQGHSFRTAGDTEVLLALYARRGMELVEPLRGMFAFALYDSLRGQLLLARDRLGQKPLWYAPLGDRVVFASEAKALLAHPGVDRAEDPESIVFYAALGYIPAPRSAWRAIRKLQPGCLMTVGEQPDPPKRYWTPGPAPPSASRAEWIERVRTAVEESVRLHMVSDVPIGALLSGGIDSSIVVALMCRLAGRAGGVRTFTAGFDSPGFDERPHARRVAEYCGTDHTEIVVRPDPAEVVERIAGMYDEPFGDSSAAATWLLCREASRHVKVALAGDGGDEVFCGYDRYVAMSMYQSIGPLRYLFLRVAGAVAGCLAPTDERSPLRRAARFASAMPYPFSVQYFMHRMLFSPSDLADLFAEDFYRQIDLESVQEWFCDLYEQPDFGDEPTRAQWHDMMTYLPDDLLVKTDIASMAESLELRSPLLDHGVAELGLALPADLRIKGRRGKQALRECFRDLLPQEVFERPKRGFALPLGDWLKGDLQDVMKETLLDKTFLNRGILRPASVHGLVNDHVLGRDDHRHRLWALMMLAKWFASMQE